MHALGKRFFSFFVLVVILLAAAFAAGFVTAKETGRSNADYGSSTPATAIKRDSAVAAYADFEPFWKAWDTINELYIGPQPEEQKKVWGAIQGLVASLDDPYSVFFPPKESSYFESEIRGDFQGVGMEIEIRDNMLTVVAPLKDTPAEKAGVKPGDQIIKIDDIETTDITIDEAVDLIRGPKGSSVTLTILREGVSKTLDIAIVRDTINIPVLQIRVREKEKVFVITLHNFSAPSSDRFREALREFVALSLADERYGLILDLRNNPGGYLGAAVDIASWFLPAGEIIVQEDFGGKKERQYYRSRGYDIFTENLRMAILINRGSASASEILAGALAQHGIAALVGERTFGKGSVQQLVDITPETSLKLTVARWLLPDGDTISETGVEPGIEVEMTEEDFQEGRDPQLEKAIEVLSAEP